MNGYLQEVRLRQDCFNNKIIGKYMPGKSEEKAGRGISIDKNVQGKIC